MLTHFLNLYNAHLSKKHLSKNMMFWHALIEIYTSAFQLKHVNYTVIHICDVD